MTYKTGQGTQILLIFRVLYALCHAYLCMSILSRPFKGCIMPRAAFTLRRYSGAKIARIKKAQYCSRYCRWILKSWCLNIMHMLNFYFANQNSLTRGKCLLPCFFLEIDQIAVCYASQILLNYKLYRCYLLILWTTEISFNSVLIFTIGSRVSAFSRRENG